MCDEAVDVARDHLHEAAGRVQAVLVDAAAEGTTPAADIEEEATAALEAAWGVAEPPVLCDLAPVPDSDVSVTDPVNKDCSVSQQNNAQHPTALDVNVGRHAEAVHHAAHAGGAGTVSSTMSAATGAVCSTIDTNSSPLLHI